MSLLSQFLIPHIKGTAPWRQELCYLCHSIHSTVSCPTYIKLSIFINGNLRPHKVPDKRTLCTPEALTPVPFSPIAFKGLLVLLIMSQSFGTFVGDDLPTTPTTVPALLWQLKSGATVANLGTHRRWLPQTHRWPASCVHWLTLTWVLPLGAEPAPDSRSLKGGLPFLFGSSMHSFPDIGVDLSEVWWPQATMPMSCHTHRHGKKQGWSHQLLCLCDE